MLHGDRMKIIVMFLNQKWVKTTAASTPSVSGYTEFHFSGVPVLFASFELSFVLRGAAAAAAWQSQ